MSTTLPPLSPLRPQPPSPGAIAASGWRWGLIGSLNVTGAIVVLQLLHSWLGPVELDLPALLLGALRWLVLLFLVFFLGRVLSLSRPLQDRAFTCVGFAATFFGLAMLVVFFVQLMLESAAWIQTSPTLIQRENRRLESFLGDPEELRRQKRDQVQGELDAALVEAKTAQEKNDLGLLYHNHILPQQLADVDRKVQEDTLVAERGLRPDTSSLALLSHFLSQGPSNQPQDAGVYPALLGSLWMALITLLFAVPIGVGAALYLEEYKSSGPLGYLIQININNLAGVPSVVFGILGAYVFVEMIFKPLEHSYPDIAARNVLGGGLTLGLLTLPVIIVSAQEAIRAVPSSIRQGAYALGATKWQVIWHQVLPLARPGILTGTILALSRAVGEAAPLVLFGALLFVNQDPSLFSRFTVLPMQIFGWADRPAIAVDGQPLEIWRYNAALASILLLLILLALNGIAIFLRNRAQRRTRW